MRLCRKLAKQKHVYVVQVCVTILCLLSVITASAAPGCETVPRSTVDAACQRELEALTAQLQEMLIRYTELHPDVRALKRKIVDRGSCASDPAAQGTESGGPCPSPRQSSPSTPAPTPPREAPIHRPLSGPATPDSSMVTKVVVNAGVTHQVMAGFGTSNRLWDDPHVSNFRSTVVPIEAQREILTRLYTDLGLTRVRLTIDPGIEPVNDNSDPDVIDWSKFVVRGRKVDDQVTFVKQAIPYGLQTYWPSPLLLERWMKASDIDEHVEWAMAVLLRLKERGLPVPYYSPMNEPGNAVVHGGQGLLATWLTEMVKRLGRRMRKEGIQTMLVIPDDINPAEAYKRIVPVLADAEARQYVGAIAYHLYGDGDRYRAEIRDIALKYKIPVWMSEFSDRDYATYDGAMRWAQMIHELITGSGVSAVDYMWGYFGVWSLGGSDSLVNMDFDNGVFRGYKLTRAYYLSGQYSRFVRPGYVRIDAALRFPGILVSAFKGVSEIVVVVINTNQVPRPVEISARGVTALQTVLPTRTSATERWQVLPAIPTDGTRFSARLAAESVTTFVARLNELPPTLPGPKTGRR